MDAKAAVVREEGGSFDIEDVELEEPRPDEVLVRVVGAGVCHTDMTVRDQLYPTPLPAVLGHEGSGIVESVGTRLSEKGNEMTVYGPAADPIVLVGDASPAERGTLRRSLADWATGVSVLALTSLAVQIAAERFLTGPASLFEPASVGAVPEHPLVRGVLLLAEPGLLFFLGGLAVFALVVLLERTP